MKYIIDIEENPLCVFDKDTHTYFPRLWRVKGFNSLVFDEEGLSRLEELNSDYINEHYGDMQDDAYERGHGIGYQKGFEDGKAVYDKGCVGCKFEGISLALSPCRFCTRNSTDYWTAKLTDDEIKVGDEVKHDGGHIFIVTAVGEIGVCGIDGDGDLKHASKCNVHRTGRHFDIQKILEEMKNE